MVTNIHGEICNKPNYINKLQKNNMKKLINFLFLTTLFISVNITAQTVSTGNGVNYYVQNVLVGNGVSVSNISINTGNSAVIGEFQNFGSTNLGLDHGIIITSGDATLAPPPNNSGSAGTNNNLAGDPDLQSMLPSGIDAYDAVILEFDFIPQSNHIEFNYVFGSEEYEEFVNGGYNDVFGFFISGPGINGPYSNNAENIALVPGTSTNVAIDNINNGTNGNGPCTNCQYFISNPQGNGIQYDGFTTVLTASADVTPCQTYHIKIAICDAGDGVYDSGVFLEANSFSTNGISTGVSFTNGNINNSNLIEGCGEAIISFVLDNPVLNDSTITYTIGGTASNGTDYSNLSGTVTFPAGSDSVAIIVSPLLDGNTEGAETVQIIYSASSCGTDTINLTIQDGNPVVADFDFPAQICEGDTVTITFTGTGNANDYYNWNFAGGTVISGSGQGPYQVVWNTPGSYNISLAMASNDACFNDTANATITVNQTPTADFITDVICEGDTSYITYTGNASSSATYNWTFPDNTCSNTQIISGAGQGPYGIHFGNGSNACSPAMITLQVIENGCASEIDTGYVMINPPGTIGCCQMPNPYAGEDDTVCGNYYQLTAQAVEPGNIGEWSVLQAPAGANVTFTQINANNSGVDVDLFGTYSFIWQETSGNCVNSDTVVITFKAFPDAYAGTDDELCNITNNLNAILSDINNSGYWLPASGVTFANPNSPTSQVTVPSYGTYTFFWVEDNGTCTDTSSVKITFLEVPNVSVTTPVDTCGSTIILHADTAGMWGPGYHGVWTGISANSTGAFFSPSDTVPDVEATIILPNGANSVDEQFQWTVSNGTCSNSAIVDVTFSTDPSGAIDINPGSDDHVCVGPDNVCYQMQAEGVGHWTIPTAYQSVVSIDDPTLPNATICVDTAQLINGSGITWGDSSAVSVPMKWSVINNNCSVDAWVTIRFDQQPNANAMVDQGVCGQDIDLVARYSISNSSGEWQCISHTSTYYEFPFGTDTNIARVHVNDYGEYTFVWTEWNNNDQSCQTSDTVKIEFIKTPTVTAGAPQSVCGDYAQLQAIEDTNATGGQWHPAAVQWVAGIGDPTIDTLQQIRPDGYVKHHTETQNCIDTVQFVWQQYVMGTVHPEVQCVAKDTTYVYFVADIQAENQTYTQTEVCGRFIDLNSAQILPGCGTARAFWIDSLNNVINWLPENGLNTTAEVGAYTPNTFWLVVQNGGDINHPVCADTSAGTHVIFREQPQVNACLDCEEIENVTLHNINGQNNTIHIQSAKTDTVCLRDGGYYLLNPWRSVGDGSWSKSRDGIFFANSPAGEPDLTPEDNDTVFVQVYNSNPGNSAGDAYILVYKAINSNNGCDASDTLIVSFAKIPSGEIEFARPYCYGDQAQVWAADDYDANPTGFNWKFYDETFIDSTTTGNSTIVDSLKKGPHFIHWPNYNDCDLLKHKVSLITSSSWGCTSSRNDVIIEEPPLVTPKYFEIPATCTQANGMVKVIEDSIVACGDTLGFHINTKWLSSTVYDFDDQMSVNPLVDSLYHVAPYDSTWLEVNYITLLTADTNYTGPQVQCKDTILVRVEDSGLIDAVIDEQRTADRSEDASIDSKGNLTGYAPLNLTLYTGTEEAKKYRWIIRDEDGNIIYESTAQYPTYTFGKGNYQVDLIVQSKEGCMDTTLYKFIIVDSESFLKIPNVFTPNGDGSNDYFQVYAKSIKAFHGMILNRWGNVIYEWDDWRTEEKGWDGTINGGSDIAAPGVYFYVIRYKGIYDDEETEEKGTLELVREKK